MRLPSIASAFNPVLCTPIAAQFNYKQIFLILICFDHVENEDNDSPLQGRFGETRSFLRRRKRRGGRRRTLRRGRYVWKFYEHLSVNCLLYALDACRLAFSVGKRVLDGMHTGEEEYFIYMGIRALQ